MLQPQRTTLKRKKSKNHFAFYQNLPNLIVTLLTFLVMIYLLVFSAQKLAQVPSVGETLEKYSRWFIAVVYLGLGMYILIENNSFDMLRTVFG